MAYSTLKSSCTEQGIFASIDGEVLKKISDILENFQLQDGESGFSHLWAPKEIGNSHVLTTRNQPFRVWGNNKELQEHRQACLGHRLLVFRDDKREVAFGGLASTVFLNRTPVQTRDVHKYNPMDCETQDVHKYDPADHRPRCKNANIFNKIWGSFAVAMFHANKSCVGVLEFVTDTPRDYKMDISSIQLALEHVGLQTSIPIDSTKRTYIIPKKRSRKTYTYPVTSYYYLAPLLGLSSARAAEELAEHIGRKIRPSTFTNICRNVGIPEWPYIRNTTVRIGALSPGLLSISDYGYSEHYSPHDSMAAFDGMKDQDNEKSINIDHPNADMISIEDNGYQESSPLDSMTDAGMKDQDNNASVMDVDYMDDEKSVDTHHLNADMISNGDNGYQKSSPPDSKADGGMKDQDNNALVIDVDYMNDEKSVDTHHPNADMISNGDSGYQKSSPSDSMADGGMKDQDNNAPVMDVDYMDDEKSVDTHHLNADHMISVGREYQYSEWSYLTGDFEPCICWTCHGMEYKGDNNPILEDLIEGQMNIENMGQTML